MKNSHTHLIYFSPTGTTQKILRSIADSINSKIITETDLTLSVTRQGYILPLEADLVLLGIPVYEEHIPKLLLPVLENFTSHGKNVAIVAVYGNVGYGIVLKESEKLLTSNGFNVIAGAAFIGEHSFSHEKFQIADGRPDKSDIHIAQKFGQLIAQKIRHNAPSPRSFPGKLPLMSRMLPEGSAAGFAHPPILDNSLCNQCGICAETCPVDAIDFSTLVVDASKCLRCFACVRACHQDARSIKLKHPWLVKSALHKAATSRQEPTLFL